MPPVQLVQYFCGAYPGAGDQRGGKVQQIRRFPDDLVMGPGPAEFFGLFHQLFPDQLVIQGRGLRSWDGITEPFGDDLLKVFPGVAAAGLKAGPGAGMADRARGLHHGKQGVPVAIGAEPQQF